MRQTNVFAVFYFEEDSFQPPGKDCICVKRFKKYGTNKRCSNINRFLWNLTCGMRMYGCTVVQNLRCG